MEFNVQECHVPELSENKNKDRKEYRMTNENYNKWIKDVEG